MPSATKSVIRKTKLSVGPTTFMNDLSFVLNFKTSNTVPQRGYLMNRFEKPDSVIQSISHTPIAKYNTSRRELEELRPTELKKPGFQGDTMTIKSVYRDDSGAVIKRTMKTFKTSKKFFTIEQVVSNIVKFEMEDRPKTNWFGGIDAHHVFFEGIYRNSKTDTYSVNWGS